LESSEFSGEEKEKLEKADLIILGNISACKMQLKQYKEVIKYCSTILKSDSKNIKILLRRSEAYYLLKEYNQSKDDSNKVLEIENDNKLAKNILEKIQKSIKLDEENERKKFKNLF
jgi:tetratricopeptide (TPR) repeat protein